MDERIELPKASLTVTSSTDNFYQFSYIFNDICSRYRFKFKLHGTLSSSSQETAIGFVTKEYDIGNKFGFGA